jgi:mRNA-degrading endonuclease RelE of RelBE toxin-antitoxin system
MTKTATADAQRANAEQQLLGARRSLAHLVELYEHGQWKRFYKEEAFAGAVRQARLAVDLQGDIRFLRGGSGALRRRVGDFRIFYELHYDNKVIVVTAVKRRGSNTY